MKPTSRAEFIKLCKENLGEPVVTVNITDEQVENIVDRSVDTFNRKHLDGSERVMIRRKITSNDIAHQYVDLNKYPIDGTVSTSSNKFLTGVNTTFLEDFNIGDDILQVQTGLINTAQRSRRVSGINTSFSSELVGATLTTDDGVYIGKVDSVISNNTLMLVDDASAIDSDMDWAVKVGTVANVVSHTSVELNKRPTVSLTNTGSMWVCKKYGIMSVVRILQMDSFLVGMGSLGSMKYQWFYNNMVSLIRGQMSQYVIARQYMNMTYEMFEGEKCFEFKHTSNKLYVYVNWNDYFGRDNERRYIVIEAHLSVNPDVNPQVWSNEWLTNWTTCLLKIQWGTNLKKFDGVKLTGDITLNGQKIYDEGMAEMEVLKKQLEDEFTEPAAFFVG